MEMLYTVSGWRAPFVLVNVSRGLSSPITLEPDHNDILAARDSGFLQIHCASCQEVLDSTLIAYRLAEDERVRLPVIVNLDGFYLSFTREPVEIPDADAARQFVGSFDPENIRFRASAPESQAVAVLGGGPYSYFRYETHLAAMNGLAVYDEIAEEFHQHFGRRHDAVEAYRVDDADYLFRHDGLLCQQGQGGRGSAARSRLGDWPRQAAPAASIAGRDFCSSCWPAGKEWPSLIRIYPWAWVVYCTAELASVLYGRNDAPPVLASFIGGLGGRDISTEEFFEIAQVLRQAVESGQTPPPRLLYTETELREVRKLQAIAQVERSQLGETND